MKTTNPSTSWRLRLDQEIPVTHDVDVLVVGGGPAGLGAAVMAARNGADTLLVEHYGVLGGMAAVAEVQPFMRNHCDPGTSGKALEGWNWGGHETCMDKPVFLEWSQKIESYLPDALRTAQPRDPEAISVHRRTLSKDTAALAAEDLCLAAGARLLYHHTLVQAPSDQGRIQCAVFHSKSGFSAIKARIYIDCTGDADLAARCGLCRFEMGDAEGHCQPMTLCFKISNVDRKRVPDNPALQALFHAARDRGTLTCQRDSLLWFTYYDDDVIHFNTTRILGRSGVDGLALSLAEQEGRSQLKEYLRWLRAEVPGYENAVLHSMGQTIGVRETRRVRGRAYLTRDDALRLAKFPDAIARCNYPIDIHSPTGPGVEVVHFPHTDYYEIPYGCIIPEGADNLAVAGRPISADTAAHGSLRIMPTACSIGQAAGVAAALAVKEGKTLPELDGVEVRRRLVSLGAWLA